jgi:signal transduction histidine kinase
VAAPLPANEAARLRALASYRILDTPPEPAFDELTELAAHVCDAPISTLTLIDRDRQWFKSRFGLAGWGDPREVSFCAYAILDDELTVVPDARRDARFSQNPLVLGEPNIRFYAGAPLIDERGYALGTLCVIDCEPRELSAEQEVALKALARAAMAQLVLHRQNAELRELGRLKDDFVSLVSHELRTPLTAISGFVEILLAGSAGPLTDDQRRYLGVVERNGRRVIAIVDDLLFLANAEVGAVELARGRVDVRDLVGDAAESAGPAAAAKGLSLTTRLDGALPVAADRDRLGQVLDNLVSNAVKFTPEGGTVELRARRDGADAVLEVADSGIGVAAHELPQLFERFYRTAAARSAGIPGTGLGLAIARAIVASHGGTIAAESEPGAGTTFRVRLPLSG